MRPDHTREFITDVNARYHDAIVDDYDRRLEGFHPAVLDRYHSIFNTHVLPKVRQLAGGAPARCLDLGCGTGYLETLLAGQDLRVTGLDVSTGMLARAREQCPDVEFIQGDLYTHPLSGPYDLVMEKAVLHHLLDWEALVDRMAALTRTGGVVFMGNEPSMFAYRGLAPLKILFRRFVNRERTQAAEQRLGDAEFEALAEYHLFHGSGINPFALRRQLLGLGFSEVRLFFSLRELLASLEERFPWLRLNSVVPGVLLDHFPLSRNFDLVAYK